MVGNFASVSQNVIFSGTTSECQLYGPRSGLTLCRAWSGCKLFAGVIRLSTQAGKEASTCSNSIYQSRLILNALFQNDIINVSYLSACYLYQVMMTLHFLNDVANDDESTQKSKTTP